MKLDEAKRWIDRHYGKSTRYEKTKAAPPPDEQYIQALSQLDNLRLLKEKERTTRELFLYDGCIRFGRWFAPSPPSVPHHFRANFRRCALALQNVERQVMNAPVFVVHVIRDEIYAEFACLPLPLSPEQRSTLDNISACLAVITEPSRKEKRDEFLQAKGEVEQILCGLRDGTLRSFLRTTLPYPLARRPIRFTTNWEGVSIEGILTSTYSAPSELLVQAGAPAVIVPRTSTRWQYGRTLVELQLQGLIDASIQVSTLQLPAMETPFNAWPNGLKLTFEVIYQACWEIRLHAEFISIWVPAPGDFGDIESWISCPDNANINYIRRAHPSMLYECFVPTEDSLSLDLGSLEPTPWHMRCRVLAEQYAMLGETREALFWLNVGVEALLKVRMEAQIAKVGAMIDLDSLDGVDAYWDQARELVAAKFPDIVDEIEWPKSNQKPSRFRQVKYFCRTVPGAPDVRDTQAS